MGDYDRILKENITAILLALSDKLLGLPIVNPRPLPDKLQTTVEREPDFLQRVTLPDGRDIILHVEFQTTDQPEMIYRLAEYRAILQRKYRLPVRQYVIYLGNQPPRMPTQLPADERIEGFTLRNLQALPLEDVLASEMPEEIILAILADYPAAEAERTVGRILSRLRQVAPDEAALRRSLTQLRTLSRLRKLEGETSQQIAAMPITYDIYTDYLYQKGRADEKARAESELEAQRRQSVVKMLRRGALTDEEIADFANASVDYVRQIKAELAGQ